MNAYKIISDFGCDLPEHLLAQYEIEVIPTNLHIDGQDNILSNEIDIDEFYQILREKKTVKTSAINMQTFYGVFEKAFRSGEDVLYIGMSKGLSGTFAAAVLAGEELAAVYPERTVRCIDTKSGSGGIALAVYLAALKREEGADLDETFTYMTDICSRLQSWFTVDDLFFLRRGGRLRTATAVVGSLFMIKPILTVDEDGKLFAHSKARGRKGSIEALVRQTEENAFNPAESTIFISHADAMQDAVNLEMMLRTKWDVKNIITTDIGPAFGAHCGPGGLAVFFIGKDETEEEILEEIFTSSEEEAKNEFTAELPEENKEENPEE